jgi:hypothetical protein
MFTSQSHGRDSAKNDKPAVAKGVIDPKMVKKPSGKNSAHHSD